MHVIVILSAFVLPHIAIASIASQHPNTLVTILILKKPTSNLISTNMQDRQLGLVKVRKDIHLTPVFSDFIEETAHLLWWNQPLHKDE